MYAEGTKHVAPRFVLFARPNGLEHPRIGFTATRRIGNAVVRNRARRVFREAYRRRRDGFRAGYDYVVVARKDAPHSSPDDLLPELIAVAARATESPT